MCLSFSLQLFYKYKLTFKLSSNYKIKILFNLVGLFTYKLRHPLLIRYFIFFFLYILLYLWLHKLLTLLTNNNKKNIVTLVGGNHIGECLMYLNNPFEIVHRTWLGSSNFKLNDQTRLREVSWPQAMYCKHFLSNI
jgi:hypothetical protein